MARRAPRTLEDFREVRGVGDKKCQDFGELFVHHIREHVGGGGGTGTKSGNFVESKEPIA
jgi:hypothetical protein